MSETNSAEEVTWFQSLTLLAQSNAVSKAMKEGTEGIEFRAKFGIAPSIASYLNGLQRLCPEMQQMINSDSGLHKFVSLGRMYGVSKLPKDEQVQVWEQAKKQRNKKLCEAVINGAVAKLNGKAVQDVVESPPVPDTLPTTAVETKVDGDALGTATLRFNTALGKLQTIVAETDRTIRDNVTETMRARSVEELSVASSAETTLIDLSQILDLLRRTVVQARYAVRGEKNKVASKPAV